MTQPRKPKPPVLFDAPPGGRSRYFDWTDTLAKVLPLQVGKPVIISNPKGPWESDKDFRKALYLAIHRHVGALAKGISEGMYKLLVRDNVFGPEGTTEVGIVRTRRK